MTNIEFADWKHHPVTQEVFNAWRNRHNDLLEVLVEESNYGDPRKLAETAAAIKIYREILEMQPEGDE